MLSPRPSFFLSGAERLENRLWCQRQTTNCRAGRIAHSAGDGGRSGYRGRLADTDHSTLGLLLDVDFDLRDVGHAGEQIPLHVRIYHLTRVPVEDAVLVQSEVQRTDHSAIALALRSQLVDEKTAVLHHEHPLHLNDACLHIDRNLCELDATGARG